MNILLLTIGISTVVCLAIIGFLEKVQRKQSIHQQLGSLWLVWSDDRIPLYRLTTSFGRRKRRCDIALPETDSGISRIHGHIANKNGCFFIYPAKKKDGSYTEILVNGAKVHPAGAKLDRYSRIKISNTHLHLEEQEMGILTSPTENRFFRMVWSNPAIAKIVGLFLSSLFMVVLFLKVESIVPADNKHLLMASLIINLTLLLTGVGYSILTKAYFQPIICSAVIILAVASSFQSFFPSYEGFLLKLYLGVTAGIATYFIWPRILMKNWHYNAIFLVVVLLLLLNLFFGRDVNGARLWVGPVQPGEIIKTLLLPLLSAYCTTNRQKILYCLSCVISCAVLLYLKDFGSVLIIGAMLMVQLYLLYDNRLLSLLLIAGTICGLFGLVSLFPHAISRLENWGKAMTIIPGGQQKQIILATLLGGFGGLGEHSEIFTGIFAVATDAALCGVQALLSWPVLVTVLCCYALLAYTSGFNCSVRPSDYFLHTALASLVTLHILLNLGGSVDLLPFSGVVTFWVSSGGTSAMTFAMLLGICASVTNPNHSIKLKGA